MAVACVNYILYTKRQEKLESTQTFILKIVFVISSFLKVCVLIIPIKSSNLTLQFQNINS